MDKWNLIIDVAGCENCNNCVLAAKDELVGNHFQGYSAPHAIQGRGVIHIERTVRGATPMVDTAYVPRMCNHCDDAPCLTAAGDGAITKRSDGIVIIDPIAARGRRDLVDACPYGAIVWNEQEQLPQSWFFDAHLLDVGAAAPRCVGVCPTQAIEAVKVSDERRAQRVQAEGLRTLKPEIGAKPRVYYKNLYRADHCFIAGSVTAAISGRIECVEGAQVTLLSSGTLAASALTDAFGDFKFDAIAPRSGAFTLAVLHSLYGSAERRLEIETESIYLDQIELSIATSRD